MPLVPGQSLSFYEILGPLGAGAMGEVYRAKDTRLDREVAIKVLPEHFAEDEERLQRFEREAKALASFNHPNIAQVFGIDQLGDTCFMALELVEGEDLKARLARGPLPVGEALEVCRQIAHGLEAAHEAGVIHRDLKPANVCVTPEGRVKLLDFGLAKPMEKGEPTRTADSVLATEVGRVLGTPTYMAPEQARGGPIDRRVDVWAFGCILYECLTGQRAFSGTTLPEVLVAIQERTPDLTRLPSAAPPRVVELLESCLEKKPEDRLRDAGDAGLALRRVLSGSGSRASSQASPAQAGRGAIWLLVGAVALVAGLVGRALAPGRTGLPLATHLSVAFDPGERIHMSGYHYFAVSPDAELMVYVSEAPAGASYGSILRLRRFDDFGTRLLVGTEEAHSPFFSPDGKWIGYFAPGGLFKVAVSGGVPAKICDAEDGLDGSWVGDHIVFPANWESPLSIVAAAGGVPEPLTVLDRERGEVSHRLAHAFQDGRFVLYTVKTEDLQTFYQAEIYLLDRESGKSRLVLRGGSDARYLESGHLVYGSSGRLFATSFDPAVGIAGPPVEVASRVITLPDGGFALFDVSRDGTLVFSTGDTSSPTSRILAYDRGTGKTEELTPPEEWRPHLELQLSRGGERLLLRVLAANDDLWTWDLRDGLATQQTFGGGNNWNGVWSLDDTEFFYSGAMGGIWREAVDSTEPPVDLGIVGAPCDVSPDGKWLLFKRDEDLWIHALDGSADPSPWLATPSVYEGAGKFSPEGDYVVFESGDPSEPDLYTARFQPGREATGRKKLVSGYALCPQWTRDTGEVIYATREGFESIPVNTDGTRRGSASTEPIQPRSDFEGFEVYERPFSVSPDGQRLYFLDRTSEFNYASVNVHFGWQDELIERVSSEQR